MIEQKQLEASIAKAAADVRANNPLAGSITNTVTIDFVANAQLAVGGSAAMVYLPDEGETLVAAGGAVYLNMGTLFPIYEETIPRTAAAAQAAGKPWVLDPVGAARAAAIALARHTEGAVVISGESDLVTDGHSVVISHGGSALMGKVTGFGCSQGGVLAVYATQTDPFTAAVAAVNHYNLAGVAAAAAADAPASFKVAFIDELFRATPEAVAGNSIEIQEA